MSININQLEIPQASKYAAKALQIINSTEPKMQELEQVIMHDPVLASTLLRYANSPLNRRSSEVSNVPTALKLLGLKSVRSAIITATMRSYLPEDNELAIQVLCHMTEISVVCKLIAHEVLPAQKDDLEFLGLIHDVGILTLAVNLEDQYATIYERACEEHRELDALERETFGISHNLVSARMAQEFRLPKLHVELLGNLHKLRPLGDIEGCSEDEQLRDNCILALAHLIRYELVDVPDSIPETIYGTIPQLQHILQLSDEQLEIITKKSFEHISQSCF